MSTNRHAEARGMFDRLVDFARVVKSSLSSETGAIKFDVVGVGDEEAPDGSEDATRPEQPAYNGLGLLGRPRPKETINGEAYFLESLALSGDDGLVPFAYRDPRILYWLNKGGGSSPKEGQIMVAGYGGAFLSFETKDAANGPANVAVLYVPYSRDANGTPQKAHAVIVDPTSGAEVVSMIHGDGGQISILRQREIMMIAQNDTWLHLKPSEVNIQAQKINLLGTVNIGNPTTAVAFAGGGAMISSNRIRYSQL